MYTSTSQCSVRCDKADFPLLTIVSYLTNFVNIIIVMAIKRAYINKYSKLTKDSCVARPCPCTLWIQTTGSPVDCHGAKRSRRKHLHGVPAALSPLVTRSYQVLCHTDIPLHTGDKETILSHAPTRALSVRERDTTQRRVRR